MGRGRERQKREIGEEEEGRRQAISMNIHNTQKIVVRK